jgi:hypothetical protein
MKIKLECNCCKSEYEVDHWRKETSKYCSRKCSDKVKKGKNNVKCTFCKKEFHMKKFQIERYSRTRGIYCSKEYQYKDLKEKMSGELNHQFGLKGQLNSSFKGIEITKKNNNVMDIRVYNPTHPFCDLDGRVLKHRLIVEEKYKLFDKKCFIRINNLYFLKKEYDVHHIDGNHNNNNFSNLLPVTKSEHTKIHNKNKNIIRDKLGKITGVFKSCELLETPEEGNQQPSIIEM